MSPVHKRAFGLQTDLTPAVKSDVLKNGCDVIQRRSDVMNRVFVVS